MLTDAPPLSITQRLRGLTHTPVGRDWLIDDNPTLSGNENQFMETVLRVLGLL